ncbi:magnesium transporter CorA family protein [Enterococcus hermanniensis]|uniref:CorA-like Mg2+ transporter n=1 Tax=Enterococcus hermanniensis TaxID=249189 RepID=A0A1L8TLB1_9ENTE|nr:magnesium transporter CorA family protein [Enterococcus hermanniensis]OJG45003.1 hypothetical protein RV04_GL002523 [Enterococcus hermanniensis]
MLDHYTISTEGVQKSKQQGNWIVVTDPNDLEKDQLHKTYDLPKDFFVLGEKYFNVSYFKKYQAKNEKIFSLMMFVNIQSMDDPELTPSTITVFLTPDVLITVADQPLVQEVLQKYQTEIFTKAALILYMLETINEHYLIFLRQQREIIESISDVASKRSNRDVLEKTTHTEKKLVYIDNLLNEQSKTINRLLDSKLVASDRDLAIQIELQTKQATVSVQIYREMLGSISGLINSMMDNRLNQLMKFLNTASLLLAMPTLIFSLWGINTGGLWWRHSEIGSIAVVLLALLVSIISGIYLFKKDYDA